MLQESNIIRYFRVISLYPKIRQFPAGCLLGQENKITRNFFTLTRHVSLYVSALRLAGLLTMVNIELNYENNMNSVSGTNVALVKLHR